MVTYIFLHNDSVHNILCNLKKNQKFLSGGKKIQVEACTRPLLCDANYDRENNDYTNALGPCTSILIVRFFHKVYMILFHMLDTFYLSNFFLKHYFNSDTHRYVIYCHLCANQRFIGCFRNK